MDTTNWKWFRIGDVFDVRPGIYHYSSEYEDGGTPYLSATAVNNGIGKTIDLSPEFEGGVVTTEKVGCTSFYQPNDFCATSDVNIIRLKNGEKLNKYVGLFLSSIIEFNEGFRWTYGRQCRAENTKNIKIKLPVAVEGTPDWQYMEEYVKNTLIPQLPEQARAVWMQTYDTHPVVSKTLKLDLQNWKPFRYDEIFDIKKGKRLTSFDQEAGDIPYIGAIDSNNGVSAYIANDKYLHAGNTISVSYNGSIGQAYYQDQPFWATDDVNVFYPKYKFNKYIAFFILPLIEKEKYRFCYGRKWTSESMRSSRMPLPIMKDGTPDWQFMEDYIKSLPYSKNI